MRDLTSPGDDPADSRPWDDAARWWPRLTEATRSVPAPVAVIDHDALRHNAMDLLVRAGGLPIRVASKSVRVRAVLDAVLRVPGFRGVLAFTLAEALWLAIDHDDIVLAYPTADRDGLARLVQDESAAARITLMVDDLAQLDLIDGIAAPGTRPEIRLAVDVDASLRWGVLGHIGVNRSPLHSVGDVVAFARAVQRRAGFRIVGMQMYEAQIAGQGDDIGAGSAVIRLAQRVSRQEVRERRADIARALTALTPLEFINGGGTGSLDFSGTDTSLTELSAGSGLLGGHLFDHYRSFRPAPAAAFAFDVVRKPLPDIVTVLGGGWIASGPSEQDRQPHIVWPEGLRALSREAAGEVQTPLKGEGARGLAVGDRVWLRHAKSGEPSERVNSYRIVSGTEIIDEVPTYRGEGKAFL